MEAEAEKPRDGVKPKLKEKTGDQMRGAEGVKIEVYSKSRAKLV